jgi:hypothetical protein
MLPLSRKLCCAGTAFQMGKTTFIQDFDGENSQKMATLNRERYG